MKFELMASMMCANYGNLEKEVRDLENGGIDSFAGSRINRNSRSHSGIDDLL